MSKFQLIYTQSQQFYKNLQSFISTRVVVNDFSVFQIHCFRDKLQNISQYLGSQNGLNKLLEITHLDDIFCSIIQSNVKQVRLLSDNIIENFQHDALKLSTFKSLRNVDETITFHKSQLTKFFSTDKEPIQWQIETNSVEALAQLQQLNEVYTLLDEVFIEIRKQTLNNEKSYLSCQRLVETLICEKKFLINQLTTLKDMQYQQNSSLRQLVSQIENFLENLEKSCLISWIILYSQTSERIAKINQDTNSLFLKLQKQIDLVSEKYNSEGTTTEDNPSLCQSKQSILNQSLIPKKPRQIIYKCTNRQENSINSFKRIESPFTYQPSIVYEDPKSPSFYYDDRAQSVEVLDCYNVDIKQLSSRHNELIEEGSKGDSCLTYCVIF